jgi:hypothetical protein
MQFDVIDVEEFANRRIAPGTDEFERHVRKDYSG